MTFGGYMVFSDNYLKIYMSPITPFIIAENSKMAKVEYKEKHKIITSHMPPTDMVTSFQSTG